MSIKKTLQNPFALIAQGFLGGAAIFYMTMPASVDVQPQSNSVQTVQSAVAARVSQA